MKHVRLLQRNGFASHRYSNKSLLSRATGRFYTHDLIGRHLAGAVLEALPADCPSVLHVIDPFCGDGRLIAWLLEAANERARFKRIRWQIHIWDCDKAAVRQASILVANKVREFHMRASVTASTIDTFVSAPARFGEFHIVVTNPPWEVLKPDRREFGSFGKGRVRAYVEELRHQSQTLAELYPISRPKLSFSGWGTNLARVGTEVALRLAGLLGVCGIVSPASLLADQMSEQLRCWIFSTHRITDVAYYPAEARLFEGVDQPSVTFVARKERCDRTVSKVTLYDAERRSISEPSFLIDPASPKATLI